jgi:DNA-binding response OmpR family regulator
MLRKKVIIIDDEVDLCRLLRTYLEELNYEVFLAHRLAEGLALIHQIKPDIIFIDNNLPDGVGWERLTFLSAQNPNCKINLISAYHTIPDQLVFANGNVNVLEKPLRLNQLKDYL